MRSVASAVVICLRTNLPALLSGAPIRPLSLYTLRQWPTVMSGPLIVHQFVSD